MSLFQRLLIPLNTAAVAYDISTQHYVWAGLLLGFTITSIIGCAKEK